MSGGTSRPRTKSPAKLPLAWAIARRELRGGLKGFRVFLACLALGVAAIAAVGSVRMAISEGLAREGAVILGGDAELRFTYRFASEEERAWMEAQATAVSEIVDFRSMVVVDRPEGPERGLTQVKAVDGAYPLKGEVELAPEIPLDDALGVADGLPGLIAEQVLIDRLGIEIGDTVRLGTQDFRLSAALEAEPDAGAGGFGLGPRVIVTRAALEDSGLLAPGTLFESHYRLTLPEDANIGALKAEARAEFAEDGMRWRDRRNGAPGIANFVDRLGAFLVLVGLAGLAVGGIGVSSAVRAYLDGKTDTIATLKTLGAEGDTIFLVYLIQIGLLTILGIALGLVLGALAPTLAGPLFADSLPVPALFSVYAAPLVEAAIYGVLAALLFTIWPLARARDIRAAGLFRDLTDPVRAWPRAPYVALTAGLLAALVGLAAWFSEAAILAYWSAAGIIGALAVLVLAARAAHWGARRTARSRVTRGRPALRLALGSVGGPGGETTSVVLSLGLGLAVLATVGQIDANLRTAISDELPANAPAYFFVDIQNDQLDPFLARASADPGVDGIETAPMLRGIITKINDRPAQEVAPGHWVLSGDRGVTYAATQPEEAILTRGEWWPEDYTGPPLVSFADEEAVEMGLEVGDRITVNVLGRELTAEIANFRVVEFRDMGINFIMVFNPSALAGAPHTHIATVYAEEEAEGRLLRSVAGEFPNITAVRVRDAIDRVTEALGAIAAATSWGAAATLITGFVVLIGAAAAGERRRVFESAVLKTLGAERGRILTSFALRSAMLGAAAGIVAIVAGGIAGWAVMTFVMNADYSFEPVSAIAIVLGGALASLLAGLAFALRPLAARPAQVLRSKE
ncbi:MAG: FtsX-like permease family protein [Pseudomonadota bacterium]